MAAHQLSSVLTSLRAQPPQQFRARNSEEARIVVTFRNLCGPAFTGIDNPNASQVPPEINRGEEAGRPPAYYKTIQHIATDPIELARLCSSKEKFPISLPFGDVFPANLQRSTCRYAASLALAACV